MSSTPKLIQALNAMQAHFRKKSQRFEKNFVASTFFLFFGFMCGNLFGTFLSFFRNTIPWDGAIIAFVLLFVEWINYLNFVILNKRTPIPSSPVSQKSFLLSSLIQLGLFIPSCLDRLGSFINGVASSWLGVNNDGAKRGTSKSPSPERKNIGFKTQWSRFFKSMSVFFQRKRNEMIRLLNFYKLGLLLGFFIDAFKVGS